MSVMSLTYYVPLVNAVYKNQASQAVKNGASLRGMTLVPLLLLAVAIIAIGCGHGWSKGSQLRPALRCWPA